MALTVGSRLGHYDVTALIGEGGMGQVYRASLAMIRVAMLAVFLDSEKLLVVTSVMRPCPTP